jgi:hypothetical protein
LMMTTMSSSLSKMNFTESVTKCLGKPLGNVSRWGEIFNSDDDR